VSTAPVRHPRAPQPPPDRPGAARHRKQPQGRPAWWRKPTRVTAVATAGAVVLAGGLTAALQARVHGHALVGTWLGQTAGDLAAWSGGWASHPELVGNAVASGPGDAYRNPLRGVGGLAAQRIDDGADFSGAGPVYAIGDGIVTGATDTNYGWPGGGWITYRLTSGPGRGLVVYVAEDITPGVTAGQRVTPGTVIGTMFSGPDGIETGWAQQSGLSAESELPEAGAIGGLGPFPTKVGVNFDELLIKLGVPGAPNVGQSAYGILPARYPASWQ
jgi:murein DD-endopeptidase MepM/ murein hydrolase activator NlpD